MSFPTTCSGLHRRAACLRDGIGIALFAIASFSHAELVIHWRDPFSTAEQAHLTAWVEDAHAAVERLVGPFPFDVHVHLHRRSGAREPVPWAHTRRRRDQSVHFHVDPAYPPSAFRQDWTAPHELSHLILPYLGAGHAWFAEGFASFMQYQVMETMGVLSPAEAAQRYQRNLERAERNYDRPDLPFVDAAPRLRMEGKYPTMYWGGAAYFLQVDAHLSETGGGDLRLVLRRYLVCCRRDRDDLPALIAALDRAAGSGAFAQHLERFRSTPGFPEWRAALAATEAR
jgi:hypothetical protein